MASFGKIAVMAGGALALGALVLAERRRPLRTQHHSETGRIIANLALGAGCMAVVTAIEVPLTRAIARRNEAGGRGLAQKLPPRLQLAGAMLAMDYGFYIWHVMTHKVPFLWRFHRVHHVDPDMDMSTAVRFHPVDMLVSLPFRLVQVRLSGAGPRSLDLWRNFFNASVLFHHSNLRLPKQWDERLSLVLTTPRMHGIHHSKLSAEQDSNWTSGFSFWDRLHGTFRAAPRNAPPPDAIDIGVADWRALHDVPVVPALDSPFRAQPERVC